MADIIVLFPDDPDHFRNRKEPPPTEAEQRFLDVLHRHYQVRSKERGSQRAPTQFSRWGAKVRAEWEEAHPKPGDKKKKEPKRKSSTEPGTLL